MSQIRTIYRGGGRFYVHPTQRDTIHPGVTTVLNMLPKPFLAPWNAKMTAELAIDSIDFVQSMAERDRDGAVSYLKGAASRYTKIRANVGSAAHDLFERMIRGEGGFTDKYPAGPRKGEYVVRVGPDMEPYRDHFAQFLAAVNPELVRAEDVAWSDTHGYAGSFDIIMRIWLDDEGKLTPDRSGTPHLIMGDWKTSKATYPDVALQMAAYMNADFIIDADGNHSPMPVFDGAAVLHITDTEWSFKPVHTGPEVFAQFLHLRDTFNWDREGSKLVIGKPMASSKLTLVTGTQRRG